MTTKTENHAEEQAIAQYSDIVRMLAAVECDYDRLEELREEDLEDLSDYGREELAQLEAAAGNCTDESEARQIIQESALDFQVRSDWASPGESFEAAEFCILLCTGGPAVRIVGELNRGEPYRARLEYQDWGTPWTQWFGARSETLCQYAANFFFGE